MSACVIYLSVCWSVLPVSSHCHNKFCDPSEQVHQEWMACGKRRNDYFRRLPTLCIYIHLLFTRTHSSKMNGRMEFIAAHSWDKRQAAPDKFFIMKNSMARICDAYMCRSATTPHTHTHRYMQNGKRCQLERCRLPHVLPYMPYNDCSTDILFKIAVEENTNTK